MEEQPAEKVEQKPEKKTELKKQRTQVPAKQENIINGSQPKKMQTMVQKQNMIQRHATSKPEKQSLISERSSISQSQQELDGSQNHSAFGKTLPKTKGKKKTQGRVLKKVYIDLNETMKQWKFMNYRTQLIEGKRSNSASRPIQKNFQSHFEISHSQMNQISEYKPEHKNQVNPKKSASTVKEMVWNTYYSSANPSEPCVNSSFKQVNTPTKKQKPFVENHKKGTNLRNEFLKSSF